MKSLFRAIREFFYGCALDVTPPAPAADNPPVETVTRNRFHDWVMGMERDVKAVKARMIEVKCYDDPAFYRAVIKNGFLEDNIGHTVWYNTKTLETVSLGDLFRKGIESGSYHCNEIIQIDDRDKYERAKGVPMKDDPREHRCIERFVNKVEYRVRSSYDYLLPHHHWMMEERHNRPKTTVGEKWIKRYDLTAEWNVNKLVIVQQHDGKLVCLTMDDAHKLFYRAGTSTTHLDLVLVDPETAKTVGLAHIPHWCAAPYLEAMEDLEFFNQDTKEIGGLYDPIRVRKLEPNEEHGLEAYVALVAHTNKDTFTRERYRVEVDSEFMFAGTICKLTTLYKGVARRLRLEGAQFDGKLYVDNFHYMCKDGTEHTPDPAGFTTIGAEPYYDRRERVFRHQLKADHGHMEMQDPSGPFIVTNQPFPEKPIY